MKAKVIKILLFLSVSCISLNPSFAKVYKEVAFLQELNKVKENVQTLQDTIEKQGKNIHEMAIRVDAFSKSIDLQANAINWFFGVGSVAGLLLFIVTFFGFKNFMEIREELTNVKNLRNDVRKLQNKSKREVENTNNEIQQLLENAQSEIKSTKGFLEYVQEMKTEIDRENLPALLYFPFESEKQGVYKNETKVDFLYKIGHEHNRYCLIKGLSNFFLEDWEGTIKFMEKLDLKSNAQLKIILGIALFKIGRFNDAEKVFESILSARDNNHILPYKYFALCFLQTNELSDNDAEWMDGGKKCFQRIYILREYNGIYEERIKGLLRNIRNDSANLKEFIEKEMSAKRILIEIDDLKKDILDKEAMLKDKKNKLRSMKNELTSEATESKDLAALADLKTELDELESELDDLKQDLDTQKNSFHEEMKNVFNAGKNFESIDYALDIYQAAYDIIGPEKIAELGVYYPKK